MPRYQVRFDAWYGKMHLISTHNTLIMYIWTLTHTWPLAPCWAPSPGGGGTKFKFVPPVAEPLWKTLCIRCTKTVRSKQSRWEKGGVRHVKC